MAKSKEKEYPKMGKEEEAELINKFYLRFRKALTGVQPKHESWKVLDTFDRGEQWKNAAIPPWVPKPVTNYIRFVRTTKRANLAAAIPRADFHAVAGDQQVNIERLHDAYKHIWQTERVDRTIRRCIDRASLQGTSIAQVYSDDNYVGGRYYGKNNPRNKLYQGKICVKRFPNMNFFPDPDAFRIEDCKYIETTEIMPLKEVKNTEAFQKYAGKRLSELQGNMLEREDDAAGTIFDRDNSPISNPQYIHGDDMVVLHSHWERYLGEDHKWHLDCTYYIRYTDFALLRIEDIQPNEYPFAILYDEEEELDFWGTSECMGILENQKVINKVAQTYSIIGVLHQNPQKVVTRESGISAQELARSGTLPGKVWQTNSDPEKSIIHLQPPEVPKGLMEINTEMKAEIKEIAGMNEAYTGNNVGSLTTSTGVNSLIERATIRDKDKLIAVDEFIERLSNLIALFVMHKWKDERHLMHLNPDGTPNGSTFVPFSDLEIDNLEWIVSSNVYARAPLTQASKRQQADHLIQLQGQFQYNPPLITPQEWVQFQDFDIGDEILQRMQVDQQKKDASEVQTLAQQITQVAQLITKSTGQGQAQGKVQQEALQFAQQIIQQQRNMEAQGKAPAAGQPPEQKGTTGAVAMQAQAQGS